MKTVNTDKAPAAIGPYSQAIISGGLVYTSGQIPVDPATGVIAGENKTLICYVNYFELQKVKTIISENKGTFSTVSTIEEILR